MSSMINPNNINGAYPIAGQDNDTQGFRDNFTNTKANFTAAQSEINALQATTAPAAFTVATTSGAVQLNYTDGEFQKITATGAITLLSFDWTGATSGYFQKMRVWINSTNALWTIILDPSVTVGLTGTITPSAPWNYVIEFSTIDGGTTVMAAQLIP